MQLVFATNNRHKLEEIRAILDPDFEVISLEEIGCSEEIPENQDTLEGNALEKARYVKEHYGLDCFADDTGLEVAALDNRPGVYSARYAGPDKDPEDNMDLILKELEGVENRQARFRTVIALIRGCEEFTFEGEVRGIILRERQGSAGFGYDPIFQPEGCSKSFAEMPPERKNRISHRGRAVEQLVLFLKSKNR